MHHHDTIAVIDFETTGMSPAMGARATEIAVVLVQAGRIVDRYASLMRSGSWVPPFIEQLTGISNRMLAGAPPAAEVMGRVAEFSRGCALVAHNASFDRGFWQHELALAGLAGVPDVPDLPDLPDVPDVPDAPDVPDLPDLPDLPDVPDAPDAPDAARAAIPVNRPTAASPPEFGCTLLLSRRLWPEAPNHKLGTLARWHGITATGRAHRALADAEMAAELWLRIEREVQRRFAASVPFGLLCALQRTPRQQLARCVTRYFAEP